MEQSAGLVARMLVMNPARGMIRAAAISATALLMSPQVMALDMVLYGIVDTGMSVGQTRESARTSSPAPKASTFGMTSGVLVGGSRWGVRGKEHLPGGWQTSFVLESGVNTTNGELDQGGLGFGRQATLSLERLDHIKLDLGLQMNLASRYFLGMDPFHGGTSQLALGTSLGNANVIRYANLLQLQLMPMQGMRVGMSYSFDAQLVATYQADNGELVLAGSNETGFGSGQKLRVVSAGLHYAMGPLEIAAGFDKGIAPASTVTGLRYKGPTAWLAGARYDFKVVAFSLIIGQSFNGAFDGQLPGTAWPDSSINTTTPGSAIRFQDGYDSRSAFLGVTIPLGHQWSAVGSWQAMQPRGQLMAQPTSATQQVVSLALLNQISPRLTAYVYASGANNYAMVSGARSQVIGAGLALTF
jgi:general bacterial porin, GBP family